MQVKKDISPEFLGRKTPTVGVQAELKELYGPKCPVCGEEGSHTGTDAHTRDDRWNSGLADLIRLCWNCNQTFAFSQKPGTAFLDGKRTPSAIAETARDHFSKGEFVAAFGCNALAAFLFEKREENYSRAMECSISAIASVRPIGHPVLLRAAIKSGVQLMIRRGGMHSFWKAEYLGQLGLTLFDYNRCEDSARCQAMAHAFYRQSSESVYGEDILLKKAAAVRRRAVVQRDDEILGNLQDADKIFEKCRNHRQHGTNFDVRAYLELWFGGSPSKVLEYVNQGLEIAPKIGNPWVIAELHFKHGLILNKMGKTKKAKEEFTQVTTLFKQHRILPEPSPVLGPLDPGIELRKLGISNAELVGVRERFPLSHQELDTVIRQVHEA